MAVNLSQNLRLTQSQQLVLTPQLQQAIKLLQLNQLELAAMVSQEMEINPVLEEEMEIPSEVEEEADNNPEKTSPKTAETSLADAHEQQQESREALREMTGANTATIGESPEAAVRAIMIMMICRRGTTIFPKTPPLPIICSGSCR